VRLCDALDLRHLSTGDLLREHRRGGTELGTQAQSFMDRGELVPDELILGMVRGELEALGDGGVLFDGFPRTVPQAEGLRVVLADLGRSLDHVVLLVADDEVLVERLSGRRSCPECGSVFNVHFNPPATEDTCDRCGHEGLVHRTDDQPDTVRNRLEVYRRQTEPLIHFYQAGSPGVRRVDADQGVDEVQAGVRAAVDG
jgi:adenylate kinase